MRYSTFATDSVTKYHSSGIHFEAVVRSSSIQPMSVSLFHFEAGGTLGEHVAPSWQLFAVVSGQVRVSADADRMTLQAGDAVEWGPGESHESFAAVESTVLILQGPEPFLT